MSGKTVFMNSKLYEYYLAVSLREKPVLTSLRLEMEKHSHGDFQISPEQGQLMSFLVKLTGVTRYLEIGVFTGYSTLAVSIALPPQGIVVACDINEEWTNVAKKYWKKAGVEKKIDLRIANAAETLSILSQEENKENYFDMAFIDADKINHDLYYEYCLRLVRRGGFILVDNVFRHGKVKNKNKDKVTQAVHDLNKKILTDERVDMCVIPISDGLTIVLKK
jgi:predicted O-methyltransferase YrrM